jgi:hypothetical protein
MFSRIWGVIGIARHAVALVILTGATTGLVAGSLDVNSTSHATATSAISTTTVTANKGKTTNTAEIDVLVRMCLATKDPQSDECAKAIDKSGMAAGEFWARVAMSLSEQVRKQDQKKDEKPAETAKPEDHKVNTGELLGLVNACVASHERSSEPCDKALDLSGLSADEFWAKVTALFNKPATTAPKTDAPKTDAPKTEKTSEEIYALIKDCLAKFEAAKNGTYSEPISTSEACRKAFEATGLTPEQFYAKFVQKTTAAKPTESPKPATTYKPQPTPTAKPQTTQTVSDADLIVMVKDCFAKYLAATSSKGNEELGRAAGEACNKAIAASGLANDAFWAKFGTPRDPKI